MKYCLILCLALLQISLNAQSLSDVRIKRTDGNEEMLNQVKEIRDVGSNTYITVVSDRKDLIKLYPRDEIDSLIVYGKRKVNIQTTILVYFVETGEVLNERFQKITPDTEPVLQDTSIIVSYIDRDSIAYEWRLLVKGELNKLIGRAAMVDEKLDRFRKQRSTGKALIVGGVLITSVSAMSSTNDSGNGVNVGVIIGSLTSVTGFIIDWTAGNHLRKIKDPTDEQEEKIPKKFNWDM